VAFGDRFGRTNKSLKTTGQIVGITMPEGPEIVIVGAGIAGAAAEATGVLAIPDRGVGIVEVLPRKHPDCLGRCP
jgi:hypothetical protein